MHFLVSFSFFFPSKKTSCFPTERVRLTVTSVSFFLRLLVFSKRAPTLKAVTGSLETRRSHLETISRHYYSYTNNRPITLNYYTKINQLLSIEIVFGSQCHRFPTDLRGHVDDSSECQPGCRSAATDYQRLDPDAEEGHRRFGVVQPELDRVS